MTSVGTDHIARLERLPLSRTHYRLLLAGGLGYTFDGADAAIIAFILPVVSQQWQLTAGQTATLASALLIGFLFGALSAGVLGDRFGRKRVMIGSLVVYTSMTLVAAASPDFSTLFVFRALTGVGIGAESAIIAPYLAEFVPGQYRGRFIGSVAGFFSFGFVIAALLGRFVIPVSPDGWRIVQVVLAVPILAVLWWRKALPESPRYLLAKGRVEQAEAVVRRMEDAVRRETGKPLPPVLQSIAGHGHDPWARLSVGRKLTTLWSKAFARRTLVTWVMWFCLTFAYYGFFTMIPKLLADQGSTITRTFTFVLYIYLAQVPGYFSAAWLSEKLDRKHTISLYLAGGAAAAVGMSLSTTDESIVAFGAALSFFMNGTYGVLYTYTPEIYPTGVRATGHGAASAFGRIGGIGAPFAFTGAAAYGLGTVFAVAAAALFLGLLTVASLGVATRGRVLEELSPDTESLSDKRGSTNAGHRAVGSH